MLVPDSLAEVPDDIGVGAGELWGESSFLSALLLEPGMMMDKTGR